jgi:hypothetical protein
VQDLHGDDDGAVCLLTTAVPRQDSRSRCSSSIKLLAGVGPSGTMLFFSGPRASR